MDSLFKSLDDISPGFRADQEERWTTFLTLDKQNKVRRKREAFLELMESYDNAKYRYTMARKVKPPTLPSIKKEMEEARQEVIKLTKRLIVELRELKNEADRIRDITIRGDQLLSSSVKKRRIGDADINDIDFTDANTDLIAEEDDEYLPWNETSSNRPPVESPKQPPTRRPRADDFTVPTPQTQPVNKPNDDDLLNGVHEEDAEILKVLKTQIKKYNCRDRVLEAIESTRVRHDISQKIALLMEDVSNNR